MAVLHNLKKVHGFDCSTIFCPFGSTSRRFVVGDPTPTHFSIQNLKFFCTHVITSKDENFTQNYLRKSCGLSLEGAISASKRVKLQCPERADSVLAILRNHGFSETQVAQVVRSYPRILVSNFEKTVLPKLHYFTSVGVSADDLAKAVASNPMLLGQSLENHIIPTHKLLRSMLPHKSVGAVLKSDSRIFMANHGTSVLPNISLLRQVGMPQSGISFLLVNLSRLVSLKHESFAQLVAEAKEMGFNMKNSTSLHAMKALWCKNTLNRSRGVFMMSWGWSEDDFISAFRKRPKSMLVSEKKIMQVMEFLVNKMGWPSVVVAKYPILFCYSLEKRIIPRFSVFEVLLLKGLVQKDLSLLHVLHIGEEQFLKRFVTKFVNQIPQLLSVYQGNVDIHDVIDTLQTESL
ncbi:hypothetical protein ACLB2K_072790 [Fragaria x ananassa]